MENQGAPNIAIISAYNEILSAHQPYHYFPDLIKASALTLGATAQFAGGTPAMCDGVTQGQDGMDLSLFSRDVIAMSAAIALSHNMFDGALYLGICDKIVPGLLIAALRFGHLPSAFVPSGPMQSGLPNNEKVRLRKLYAEGKVDRNTLLDAEKKSYHSPGTCTFYGTANSNQMLLEIMGLQLPGSSFVTPYTPLRDALTAAATETIVHNTSIAGTTLPLYKVFDERSIVNGMIGLLSTGGSTNHTIHLIAIARAAGIVLNWDDFNEISKIIPLICRIYPSGDLDINHFHNAGGVPRLLDMLISSGLIHSDANTILGKTLTEYTCFPLGITKNKVQWADSSTLSSSEIFATIDKPFRSEGGLTVLKGNLGRAIIKTSAINESQYSIQAPAIVFETQQEVLNAFEKGALHKDVVIVLRFQGPMANGMPELHKLTAPLSVLQDLGYHVALITDGRLSGASGKIPAAIHVTPEAAIGGPLAYIQNGDQISIDATKGTLEILVGSQTLQARNPAISTKTTQGTGRELFANMRKIVSSAEEGGSFLL